MSGTRTGFHVRLGMLIVLGLLFLQPTACLSAIVVGQPHGTGGGTDPVADGGWPLGSVAMANLPTRVGWRTGPPFGGGEWGFFYRCRSTEEFNRALATFAAIRAPKLEVVLHDGPEHSHWLDREGGPGPGPETRIDWTFTVWNPESWHQTYNDPTIFVYAGDPNFRRPVAPPRLDVYVGGGSIVWEEVNVPETLVVTDRRAASALVRPVGGGLARGDVYDMSTGKPIAGAAVVLSTRAGKYDWEERMRGRTDDLGSFQIEKIPAGRYRVSIEAEGYASRRVGDYENGGSTYHEFTTELAGRSSIGGVVTDAQGKPIAGAKVQVTNVLGIDGRGYAGASTGPTITDEQGRFQIDALPVGFTQLRCHARSLHLANSIFQVYHIPSEPITLVMERTGAIRGKVLDVGGRVIARQVDVLVCAVGRRLGKWGGSAKCGTDSSFEFTDVPPGKYLVAADLRLGIQDRVPNAQEVSVEAGKTIEVTVIHAGL